MPVVGVAKSSERVMSRIGELKSGIGELKSEIGSLRQYIYKIEGDYKQDILNIMERWSSIHHEFDGFWNGYSALLDELLTIYPYHSITIKKLKMEMKELSSKGLVEMRPAYDSDYRLCGSGWFIKEIEV
jgi:hypothetical protein